MKKVLCFVSNDMADFEVTLAFQFLKAIGNREIVTVGYDLSPVVSQSGFTYLPACTVEQGMDLAEVEAMILPGGPIRPQRESLTELILQTHRQNRLVAAICFGPQYLGRAGILDHHRYTTSCSAETIRSLGVADPFPRSNYVEARVVQDRQVITAKGGAFVDFAFAVGDALDVFAGKGAERERLFNEMLNR